MNYIVLFFLDGVLGYAMQAFGYSVAIHSINKQKIKAGPMAVLTISITLAIFAVRSISIISSGFHTILIMIIMILIATIFFKMSIYHTTLGVLLSTVLVLFFEVLSMFCFQFTISGGIEAVNELMNNPVTISDKITRAALGIPTNIAMVATMLIVYVIRMKDKQEKVKQEI